jgi:Trypsin-like peptidase domain/Thioredoxin
MTIWLYLFTSLALLGNKAERTILHFSEDNCGACRAMQPLIDSLNAEGWVIRSIDAEKERVTRDRWRVRAIPTLIVLENGAEVDRIEGTLPMVDLRKRLTGNETPHAVAKEPANSQQNKAISNRGSTYGPNHPYSKAKSASNSNQSHQAHSAFTDAQRPLIGPNHPLYPYYHPSRLGANDVLEVPRPQPRRERTVVNPLLKDIHPLPELPDTMAATVRIRVKYPISESMGTGTIIDVIGDQAIVLTCGHLFRKNETKHPVTVELFQNGKIVQVLASMLDCKDEKVDLGLISFRQPSPVTKVLIRPKVEKLQELDSVFSIGCDRGAPPSRKDSVISKLNRYLGPSNVEIAGAPVQGRSGGGLFDAKGRLIGVCFASDEELDEGLFVGPEAIYAQLEKNGLNHLFDRTRSATPY